MGSSELWKDEKKSFGKRRALVGMLDLLDSFGLSKHRSNFLEVFNFTLKILEFRV